MERIQLFSATQMVMKAMTLPGTTAVTVLPKPLGQMVSTMLPQSPRRDDDYTPPTPHPIPPPPPAWHDHGHAPPSSAGRWWHRSMLSGATAMRKEGATTSLIRCGTNLGAFSIPKANPFQIFLLLTSLCRDMIHPHLEHRPTSFPFLEEVGGAKRCSNVLI